MVQLFFLASASAAAAICLAASNVRTFLVASCASAIKVVKIASNSSLFMGFSHHTSAGTILVSHRLALFGHSTCMQSSRRRLEREQLGVKFTENHVTAASIATSEHQGYVRRMG